MLVLFNKPFRVLSQFTTDTDKQTLADYIDIKGVYPAGRLDYDSEGLLLLTDDGKLQQRIANPRYDKLKEYWVQVEGIPRQDDLDTLRHGVTLKDGPTKPAQVSLIEAPPVAARIPPIRERKHIPVRGLNLGIREGRNRQVRRMTANIGYPTLRLIRHRIDRWRLDGLSVGEYRVIEE